MSKQKKNKKVEKIFDKRAIKNLSNCLMIFNDKTQII